MKKYDTIKALLRQDNYNSFLDNLVRGLKKKMLL